MSRTIEDIVRSNRPQIDAVVRQITGDHPHNDEDRRLWLLNHEGLYLWAQSIGYDPNAEDEA